MGRTPRRHLETQNERAWKEGLCVSKAVSSLWLSNSPCCWLWGGVGWEWGSGAGGCGGMGGAGGGVTQSRPAHPTLPHPPLTTSAASSAPRLDTPSALGLADLVVTRPRKFCHWLGALVAESRRSTHMSEETAGNLRPQASDRTAVALVLSGLPSAPSLLPTPNHGPRRLLASLGPSLREPAVVQRAPRDQCPQSRAGPLKVHDCLH